jgi:hypothetical protein
MSIKYFLLLAIIMEVSCSTGDKKDDLPQYIFNPEQLGVGIKKISGGFDSLQIRLWNIQPFGPHEIDAITIECSNGECTGSLRRILFKYNDDSLRKDQGSFKPYMVKSNVIHPKSGWDSVLVKLESLNIYLLPEEHKVLSEAELRSICDCDTYVVEFATKDSYRTYSYTGPHRYSSKYLEVKNIIEILSLVEKEFGVPLYWNIEDNGNKRYRAWKEFDLSADSVLIK